MRPREVYRAAMTTHYRRTMQAAIAGLIFALGFAAGNWDVTNWAIEHVSAVQGARFTGLRDRCNFLLAHPDARSGSGNSAVGKTLNQRGG